MKKISPFILLIFSWIDIFSQTSSEGYSKHPAGTRDSIYFYQNEMEKAVSDNDSLSLNNLLTSRTILDTTFSYSFFSDSVTICYYPTGQVAFEKIYYTPSHRYYGRPAHYYNRKNRYYRAASRYRKREARWFERGARGYFPDREYPPLLDSTIVKYYPNGRQCYEKKYFNGHCVSLTSFYSNGQECECSQVRNGMTDADKVTTETSFYIDYGDYIYIYGFKVKKRICLKYNYNGTPYCLIFEGRYCHKKVKVSLHYLYGLLNSVWIYDKNGLLIAQFDWDRHSETWKSAGVPHVRSKKDIRKGPKERRKYKRQHPGEDMMIII